MKACITAFLLSLSSLSAPAIAQAGPQPDAPDLQATIAGLDAALFDAFNRCADPAQLAVHAGYFDPAVEFYHDTGGVTWNREDMLANTRRYACGHYIRQLVPGSLRVYPVKDFGAIAQGEHRFCQTDGSHCDGLADFTMLWRLRDGRWQVTRVLSYGHRAATDQPLP